MLVTYCLGVFLLLVTTVTADLPKGWKACKQKSPDYKECSMKAISEAIKSLKDGNKQLGLPPFDPLKIPTTKAVHNEKNIKLNNLYTDTTYNGFTNFKFLDFKNDWNHLMIKMFFDEIILKGKCDVNGTIYDQPISGNRTPATYTWSDMTLIADLDLKKMDNKGKLFFQVPKMKIDLDVGKSSYVFNNLFDGEKAKGDSMNQLLTEKSEAITEELKSAIVDQFAIALQNVANIILSKIPSNEIAV